MPRLLYKWTAYCLLCARVFLSCVIELMTMYNSQLKRLKSVNGDKNCWRDNIIHLSFFTRKIQKFLNETIQILLGYNFARRQRIEFYFDSTCLQAVTEQHSLLHGNVKWMNELLVLLVSTDPTLFRFSPFLFGSWYGRRISKTERPMSLTILYFFMSLDLLFDSFLSRVACRMSFALFESFRRAN